MRFPSVSPATVKLHRRVRTKVWTPPGTSPGSFNSFLSFLFSKGVVPTFQQPLLLSKARLVNSSCHKGLQGHTPVPSKGTRDIETWLVTHSIHRSDFLLQQWAAVEPSRAIPVASTRPCAEEPEQSGEAAENPGWKRRALLGSRREVAASAGRGWDPDSGTRIHPSGTFSTSRPCRATAASPLPSAPQGHGAAAGQCPGTCGNAGLWDRHGPDAS